MLGRCERVLKNSGVINGNNSWTLKQVTVFILKTIVAAAMVGLFLGIALGLVHRDALSSAATLGSVFGGFVGFIIGLLVGTVRKLRHLCSGSIPRAILVFASVGAIGGALVFSPFSEGLTMMLVQAFEGAIAGALIGGIVATILGLFRKIQ